MKSNGSSISPRVGTIITGGVAAGSSLIALWFIKFFNRKTLIIWGHVLMAIVHSGVAVFIINDLNNEVLVFICLFIFIYDQTSGPMAWIYATETTVDTGLGVCLLTLWGTTFVLSLVCPVLMDKDFLGESNTFFLFSAMSLMGAFYSYFLMKETKGLSDKEKKNLYNKNQ